MIASTVGRSLARGTPASDHPQEHLDLLRGEAGHTALVSDDGSLTYAQLRERVVTRRSELGETRRLVMIEGVNAVEPVVTYLAALAGGHPVLFVGGGADADTHLRARPQVRSLVERFDPDVIAGVGDCDGDDASGWHLDERRTGTRHELHPDLAMLASTSGSTGSPKLVKLSHRNLLSNAEAIGGYLGLTPADRAVTSLPLHYCYGLSVLNSHLVMGASVRLTERSVVDERFWRDFVEAGATSFAGVPHTFDLLESAGFADRHLPTLRYITQAGGRLHADRVRRFAQLGRDRDFDLVVMYGQTEATARMAYVPPHLVHEAPEAIGIPIEGGSLSIDAAPGSDTGELIYRGPNVMMGYAAEPSDLGTDATVTELRTGDLARCRSDGLYEIVGRCNRIVKVFGLRIDLDRVENLYDREGMSVRAVGLDEQLVLFVLADRLIQDVAARATVHTGLPAHSVRVHAVAEFPRTPNGKPDTAALVRFAGENAAPVGPGGEGPVTPESLRILVSGLLGRPDATVDDSFVSLGGDSLSYIEVSLQLADRLGTLPTTWPSLSMLQLSDAESPASATERAEAGASTTDRPRSRRFVRVEMPVLLRAAAILLIVATHAGLLSLQGGAHLLLVAAGYNLARFQLADVRARRRSRTLLASAADIAVPAVVWIGGVAVLVGGYALTTVLLVNGVVVSGAAGGEPWSIQWRFWFLEALLWPMLALAVAFAIPAVDRLERRRPFGFALAVLALALVMRVCALAGLRAEETDKYAVVTVVWLLALGWAVARCSMGMQRGLVSAIGVVSVVGFFGDGKNDVVFGVLGDGPRSAVVIGGLLLLVWVSALAIPRVLVRFIVPLASASLFIYLTQWQVYPLLEKQSPLAATVASVIVGFAVWKAYSVLSGYLRGAVSAARLRRGRRRLRR